MTGRTLADMLVSDSGMQIQNQMVSEGRKNTCSRSWANLRKPLVSIELSVVRPIATAEEVQR